MKTTTLFIICLIVFSAILITFFYVFPTYATQANSFLLSVPSRIEGVASWATQNLATITALVGAIGTPLFLVTNYVYGKMKQAKTNEADLLVSKAEATASEAVAKYEAEHSLVETQKQTIANLKTNAKNFEALITENESLKKLNERFKTERDMTKRIKTPTLDEMVKTLQQEGYVVKVPVK